MTDRAQFEAMLEALINEDQETAKEIFHNIVVAKSREIYEELLSEDFEASDTGNPYAQEAFGDEEDDSEEEPADDEADDADMSDDEEPADDEEGDELDFGDDEESDDSMDDAEQSDRILDLEDALEELKAEFEQLMAGEDDMGGDDMGGDDMEVMPEEGDDMMAMEPMEGDDELMLEYKNKVPSPKHGDNGQNTKSVVANPNRMGGANMMAGSREESGNGGTQGGLAKNKPVPNPDASGNINVPGGNAGKTAFKKKEPGHGAEKKSTGDNGDNKTSPISGLKSRAK